MNKWTSPGLGLLVCLALAPIVRAQVPTDAGAGAGAVPATAPAAPTSNLWSFFCPTADQEAKCKAKICNSPLGLMLKSAAGPFALMSGGLIGSNCGTPTAQDLLKMKLDGTIDGPAGVAAEVKKSEADAKARREAVRYLGTVDCNYWPKARVVLKDALRLDPNECVRYEAALALLHGCCCNREIIDYLRDSSTGGDKYGPIECSWRVRETAGEAMIHCTEVYQEVTTNNLEKEKSRKEETKARPPERGKGLLAIFASASQPARNTTPPPPLTAKAQAAPAPMPIIVEQEKVGLLQRLGITRPTAQVEWASPLPSAPNMVTTGSPSAPAPLDTHLMQKTDMAVAPMHPASAAKAPTESTTWTLEAWEPTDPVIAPAAAKMPVAPGHCPGRLFRSRQGPHHPRPNRRPPCQA